LTGARPRSSKLRINAGDEQRICLIAARSLLIQNKKPFTIFKVFTSLMAKDLSALRYNEIARNTNQQKAGRRWNFIMHNYLRVS
jgi:hypothetical protein